MAPLFSGVDTEKSVSAKPPETDTATSHTLPVASFLVTVSVHVTAPFVEATLKSLPTTPVTAWSNVAVNVTTESVTLAPVAP